MGLLSRIGFIERIAELLSVGYWIAFALAAGAVLLFLVLIICVILLIRMGRKKARRKKALEKGQSRAPDVLNARDQAADGRFFPSVTPETRQPREIESSYKGFGTAIPIKPDISDSELLDIIYTEIVSKRENISKNAFLSDKKFSQAYLEYVKERLIRLQLRGFSTREALDIYFYGAPLVIASRREQHTLSELERQTIKHQKIKALETDIQTIILHITAIEKNIYVLNETLASTKNKKQKTELRRKIAEHSKELELTRRQLALMREKEESELRKEAEKHEEEKPQPAPAPQPAPIIQPLVQPVVQPIVFTGAPQPVYAVQYVDYAQRAELMAELKALIILVNESHASIRDFELRNAELSIKREKIRGQLSALGTEAMRASSAPELDRYTAAAQSLNNELNSLVLDMEICAGDKAQVSRDIYNAHNRINGIIRQLGLTYPDVLKIEEELLVDKGVMRDDESVDWGRRSETARAELNSYINDEKARVRLQHGPQYKKSASDETDELRMEYVRRIREMEEERIAFFRDYAKSAHDQNGPERQLKPNTQVPPGYVLLRKRDGSIAMIKRSGLPKNAAPARNVPERVVRTLPDGSVIRADGSMVRPDGRIMRPVKTKDDTTKQFREIVMTERRELQRQSEEAARAEERKANDPLEDEINKIEKALMEGKKGK